jgi:hypothetical protein
MDVTAARGFGGGGYVNCLELGYIEVVINMIANGSRVHDVGRVFSTVNSEYSNGTGCYWRV